MFSAQGPEGDGEEDQAANELAIDEDLSLVERVKLYSNSSISVQRLVHVKELASCAEQIGAEEALKELLPLLDSISSDLEISIRQALAEQMVGFSKVLLAAPSDLRHAVSEGSEPAAAYDIVVTQCVPILSKLLSGGGGTNDLSSPGGGALCDAAAEALVELAGLLKADDVGQTVLTAVLCLAHDNEVEENRVVATQLLGALAATVGKELCCQFVLPEIVSLADDPVFRVRKAAAMKIGALCSVVGEDLSTQRLLPVFEVLSRDEIWGVRKASVESLAEVAAVMPPAVRTGQLVDLFRDFHDDGSRWVRIAACEALGPFIATLPAEHITPELLTLFTQLATPSSSNAADSDIGYYCAFNFPAVVQAVGPSRWGELSDAFETLSTNIQWKVRRTLAFSLHALAEVLGRELTAAQLLPTFDRLLKDLDEVKVGVIRHLCAFLAVLEEGTRLTYLPTLSEIRAETDNWRFRQILALQLAAFGQIFPRAATLETLAPLALDLCTDPVAAVREAAISQVGLLLALLLRDAPRPLEEGTPLHAFVATICGMASMQSCHKRANFVHICASLVGALDAPFVTAHLLPHLTPLATDRVPNVRLPLGQLLTAQLESNPDYASSPLVAGLGAQLRADADRDVLRSVHDASFEPPPYRCKAPPDTPAAAAAGADGAGAEPAVEPAGAYAAAIAPPDGLRPEEQGEQPHDPLWNPRNSLGPNGAVAGPPPLESGTPRPEGGPALLGDEAEDALGLGGGPPAEQIAPE